MSELDGRVVAIAGASGGLGPSVAKRLAAGGARIAGVDRSEEHLEALRAELGLPDDRFDAREKASAALVALGAPAAPLLRLAAKSLNVEVAIRAKECLQRMESDKGSLRPGTAAGSPTSA